MYETDSVTGVTTLSIIDPVTQQPINKSLSRFLTELLHQAE